MDKAKNTNDFLRSNDVLYRIFDLWFESQIVDEETSSVYMNSYEHHANYITTHWNDENSKNQ